MKQLNTLTSLQKGSESENSAIYEGKEVKIITIFTDIDVALVEDENGEIFDVQNSLLR